MKALPSSGFVRVAGLLAPDGPLPICRSTLYAWIKSGRFPKPVKIGPRTSVFDVEEVHAFLAKANGGANDA